MNFTPACHSMFFYTAAATRHKPRISPPGPKAAGTDGSAGCLQSQSYIIFKLNAKTPIPAIPLAKSICSDLTSGNPNSQHCAAPSALPFVQDYPRNP